MRAWCEVASILLVLATTALFGCGAPKSVKRPADPHGTSSEPLSGTASAASRPGDVDDESPTNSSDAASTAETSTTLAARPDRWVELTPRIRWNSALRAVELDAVAVLKEGFLEQYICTVGTREHEALFVFEGRASEVHAALMLVGLEPGAPGRWREIQDGEERTTIEAVPPSGPLLSIHVRLPDDRVHSIDWFARAAPINDEVDTAQTTPPSRFVFAGSRFVANRRTGEERYAADSSGSLVGLVTFGDETIAALDVIPDQARVAEPVWEANGTRMPEPGTKVKIVIAAVPLSSGRFSRGVGFANASAPRVVAGIQTTHPARPLDGSTFNLLVFPQGTAQEPYDVSDGKEKGPVETEPQTEPFRGQIVRRDANPTRSGYIHFGQSQRLSTVR
jgi:hypothetical protein